MESQVETQSPVDYDLRQPKPPENPIHSFYALVCSSYLRHPQAGHKRAKPRLLHWCDEASVAHWTQPYGALPSWTEADERMRAIGRISKVLHPSPQHATMTYSAPRTTATAEIRRY
jgi:hypothetical protein